MLAFGRTLIYVVEIEIEIYCCCLAMVCLALTSVDLMLWQVKKGMPLISTLAVLNCYNVCNFVFSVISCIEVVACGEQELSSC